MTLRIPKYLWFVNHHFGIPWCIHYNTIYYRREKFLQETHNSRGSQGFAFQTNLIFNTWSISKTYLKKFGIADFSEKKPVYY